MKLLDRIKGAIFEDEEFDEEFEEKEPIKEEKVKEKKKDDIVKKIDIEKTIPKRIDLSEEVEEKEEVVPKAQPVKRELRRTPVIFDEEDFVMDEVAFKEKPKVEANKDESKKSLYGGYRDEKAKEKFRPSPVISPVYGFVGVSPVLEQAREDTSEKHFFVQDKKPEMSLDAIRQKAFGDKTIDEDDDLGLLYEMKKENDAPAISKITLGDAEEYFEDLGLEYNVDYKDEAKEKKTLKEVEKEEINVSEDVSDIEEDINSEIISSIEEDLNQEITSNVEEDSNDEVNEEIINKTRSTKNKKLSEEVESEIEKEIESTKELEITKEQLKPKTAKEIKKVKKIEDSGLGMIEEKEEEQSADEKNLYDLIDMMYDSK